MFPAIAMDASGAFVISWTSYGQGGDAPYESNVYAKQYVSNDSIRANNTNLEVPESTTISLPGAKVLPLVVTTDDPANHVVAPGAAGMSGVVEIVVNRTDLPPGSQDLGSGALLRDGRHILTAAHVVCDNLGNMVATAINVTFNLAGGPVTVPAVVTGTIVNPQYTGDVTMGGDLAILTLAAPAPGGAQGYGLYTQDAVGQVATIVGYGLTGTGATGDIQAPGTEHTGQNKFEGNASLLGFNADELIYDFDNGTAANDAFGQLFGIHDLGVGVNEASGAPGDSGGPNFINGLIAGVTSYGVAISGPWDVLPGINSSFGDIGADVNVSLYADWITSMTLGTSSEIQVNTTTASNQKWSSVAMDTQGDFVVTWTSYGQDGGGNGPGPGANGENGVYARRFAADGTAASGEFKVNTFTENNQQAAKVAMDAAGDFTIVWESFQDRPANGAGTDSPTQLRHLRPALRPHQPVGQVAQLRPQRRTVHRVPGEHDPGRRSALSGHRHGRQRRLPGGLER